MNNSIDQFTVNTSHQAAEETIFALLQALSELQDRNKFLQKELEYYRTKQ